MKALSIRVRLTAWYLAVVSMATLGLGVGSWWFVRRSVIDAADATVIAQIEGVRQFIGSLVPEMPGEHVRDEFEEYAQLTRGQVLLDVQTSQGPPLVHPAVAGWDEMCRGLNARPFSTAVVTASLHGEPVRVARVSLVVGPSSYVVVAAMSMEAAFDALDRLEHVLMLLLPAVVLFAGAGGYWLSGRALAPVDAMTRSVQAITVQHLNRRLDVPRADDELSRLAVTFNGLLGRVETAVSDLSGLIAEASHELRTPVSLVRTTAEVALTRERPADEYRQALTEVLAHAERTSTLVDDLLTLARADAGVEAGEVARLDLVAVTARAVGTIRRVAETRGLTIDVHSDADAIWIRGDAASIERLLLIVLDNAVKYTIAGGVSVHIARTPSGEVHLRVVDTGLGIQEADRPLIFDRFYRGAAARQHNATGAGLGLAIARTIVMRHGGTIDVRPRPAGGGTEVDLRLPSGSA